MGWLDYHLHGFRITRPGTDNVMQIGIPDEDAFEGDEPILPGWDGMNSCPCPHSS